MNIYDRVHARDDLTELRALRDLDGITAALNAENLTARQHGTIVTWRAVVTKCAAGKLIRTKMEAAASHDSGIKSACEFLSQDAGLDVGDEGCWQAINDMVEASVLTTDEAEQLKSLAMKPLQVTRLEVEAALYNPDGREK